MIRAAVLCWFGVSVFLACLFLLPRTWSPLLWIVYVPSLLWFARWTNQGQDRTRLDDRSDGNGSDGGAAGEGIAGHGR